MQTLKFLKKVAYSNFYSWSVRYLLESNHSYNEKYSFAKIGDFLKRNKTIINIEDTIEYNRVTVKIKNRGVELRDIEKGINIGTKRQYLVKSGQFIVSKIDARNGSFGIIPDYLEKAIVTNDFPLFDIDKSKINPDFLLFITTTNEFIKFAQSCSSGTTNRQRMDIDKFLDQKIPLPSIEEQNRIIYIYNTKLQLAQEQISQAKELEASIEKYLSEELGIKKEAKKNKKNTFLNIVNYRDFERWDGKDSLEIKSIYKISRFGKCILEISTGTTPTTSRSDYFNGEINFYTPADLTNEMYLTRSERKVTDLAINDRKARKFEKGTLLFVGIGSTVGKVGIVENEIASSNQQITGFKLNPNLLNIEYTYYYFDIFKNITTKEKTQATIPIVNQDKITNIPIPVPPIEKQKEISQNINSIKAKIKELNVLSVKNREEAILVFEKQIFKK